MNTERVGTVIVAHTACERDDACTTSRKKVGEKGRKGGNKGGN